jgi:cob(I)alamin adenosyltransferase
MGNRLSKIYTRTGDEGSTGLGDGSRIAKDSLRVEAMGDVDELNAVIGILMTTPLPANYMDLLQQIQHDLFDMGAEICIPGHSVITQARVDALEVALDAINDTLSPLKEFILPGGTLGAAYCHLARTVSRRAERRLIALSREASVSPIALKYINRLSDFLFVLCRGINLAANHEDVLWRNQANAAETK